MLEEINKYLVEKYHPKAIFFHGSRLRNMHNQLSDWDFTIVLKNTTTISSEIFNSENIDLITLYLDEVDQYINFDGDPINPIKLIFDDRDKLGEKLLIKTNEIFAIGPPKISEQEFQNQLNFLKRASIRLLVRGEDKVCRNHALSLFYTNSIKLWFATNQRWTEPIYIASQTLQKDASEFHHNLAMLFTEEYYVRSMNIIDYLAKIVE